MFNSIEDIEEYLKTNKGKVINMYDKSYIPDLFGNSLRITREQLDYAMTL